MYVRPFRQEDIPALLLIQRAAAQVDGPIGTSERELEEWLSDPARDAASNAFVITDDSDEMPTWGQGDTLEGREGEILGYTCVQGEEDAEGYHITCLGAVHPQWRRQHAGRALLICALNRAYLLATEYEAEHQECPIYFAVLLPRNNASAASLAAKCELSPGEHVGGMQRYQRLL